MLCVCAFTFILMHRMLANGFIPLVDALQVKTVVERSGGNGQPGPSTHLVGNGNVLCSSYMSFWYLCFVRLIHILHVYIV